MPEVYTLRAPENFNYTNGHRLASNTTRDNQNNDDGKMSLSPSRSDNFLQPSSSSPVHRTSNPRAPTATKKQEKTFLQRILHREKPQTSHIDSQDKITTLKSNGLPSPSRNRVKTYTITSPDDNRSSSHVSHTPSSPISHSKKKAVVTFDQVNSHDSFDTFEERYYPPMGIAYIPLGQSKAMQSIDRSMNLYRFRRY